MGVSGVQSNRRTPIPLGRGSSHGIGVVDCWQCQAAGTPILDRGRSPGVGFITETSRRRQSRGYRGARLQQHIGTSVEDAAFTDCPFGYCLIRRVDRPPPADSSEPAPFRPVPIRQYGGLWVNVHRGNLRTKGLNGRLCHRVTARIHGPAGRVIGPVQSITTDTHSRSLPCRAVSCSLCCAASPEPDCPPSDAVGPHSSPRSSRLPGQATACSP